MLKITNPDKMVGQRFLNGRFVCLRTQDSITQWRFQFEDLQAPTKRLVWIEVNKVGKWDDEEGKIMYILNYPNCPLHRLSFDYFNDFKNATDVFEMALKEVEYVKNT